jgi:hypothetical protein
MQRAKPECVNAKQNASAIHVPDFIEGDRSMKKKIASVLSVMFIAMMSAASSASPVAAPGAAAGNEMSAVDSASTPATAPGAGAEAMKMAPACGWDCLQEGGYCCGPQNMYCCGL